MLKIKKIFTKHKRMSYSYHLKLGNRRNDFNFGFYNHFELFNKYIYSIFINK